MPCSSLLPLALNTVTLPSVWDRGRGDTRTQRPKATCSGKGGTSFSRSGDKAFPWLVFSTLRLWLPPTNSPGLSSGSLQPAAAFPLLWPRRSAPPQAGRVPPRAAGHPIFSGFLKCSFFRIIRQSESSPAPPSSPLRWFIPLPPLPPAAAALPPGQSAPDLQTQSGLFSHGGSPAARRRADPTPSPPLTPAVTTPSPLLTRGSKPCRTLPALLAPTPALSQGILAGLGAWSSS